MPKTDSLPAVWEQAPHTKAKHDILVRYLGAWFAIFGASRHHRTVNVLDGFAGPGKYKDGEPGSPVLALNTLLDHKAFANYGSTRFRFVFNELDAARYASLAEVLDGVQAARAPWPQNVLVEHRNQNFQLLAQQMLDAVGSGRQLAPTFAFVDPFGYCDVPMTTIRDLVRNDHCDLFIYFDFNSVNRFATAGNVDHHLAALFGTDEYKNAPASGPSRAKFLHDLYESQLRKECRFAHICSFKMINSGGHTGSYLFFCTRDSQAYDRMKEAMWKVAPTGDFGFDDRYADQPMLFGDEANTGPLQDQLAKHFAGQTVAVEQVVQYVTTDTDFYSGQVRTKTLRPMQIAGRISSPNQKRKNQFPAGTLITFPALD